MQTAQNPKLVWDEDLAKYVTEGTESGPGAVQANPAEDIILLAGIGTLAKAGSLGIKAMLNRAFKEAIETDASKIILPKAQSIVGQFAKAPEVSQSLKTSTDRGANAVLKRADVIRAAQESAGKPITTKKSIELAAKELGSREATGFSKAAKAATVGTVGASAAVTLTGTQAWSSWAAIDNTLGSSEIAARDALQNYKFDPSPENRAILDEAFNQLDSTIKSATNLHNTNKLNPLYGWMFPGFEMKIKQAKNLQNMFIDRAAAATPSGSGEDKPQLSTINLNAWARLQNDFNKNPLNFTGENAQALQEMSQDLTIKEKKNKKYRGI